MLWKQGDDEPRRRHVDLANQCGRQSMAIGDVGWPVWTGDVCRCCVQWHRKQGDDERHRTLITLRRPSVVVFFRLHEQAQQHRADDYDRGFFARPEIRRPPAGRANLLKAFPQKTGQYRDTFSSIISNVVSSTASTRARRCFLPLGHHGHGMASPPVVGQSI